DREALFRLLVNECTRVLIVPEFCGPRDSGKGTLQPDVIGRMLSRVALWFGEHNVPADLAAQILQSLLDHATIPADGVLAANSSLALFTIFDAQSRLSGRVTWRQIQQKREQKLI